MKTFYTYITFAFDNSSIEIGVTNNLERRLKLLNLNCKLKKEYYKLVYFEEFSDSKNARDREIELGELHSSLIHKLVDDTNPMNIDLLA